MWWGFVFPVIMAGLIVEKPVAPEDERGSMVMNLLMVTALVAFVAVLSPWSRDRVDPSSGATALVSYAPQRMVDAVHRVAPADAKLFVTLPYASWFEFASPSNPMFVDPRIELFPHDIWDDYFAVGRGARGVAGHRGSVGRRRDRDGAGRRDDRRAAREGSRLAISRIATHTGTVFVRS